jgi:uncharacterized membrane protein
MGPLSPALRKRLLTLRSGALVLLLCFLMEPTLTRKATETVLPLVGILIDQSGSMTVKDANLPPGELLAEAVGLDLVSAGTRQSKTNTAEQAASDKATVAMLTQDPSTAARLAQLAGRSRFDRAATIAQRKVLPALASKARVKTFTFDSSIAPLDLNQPPKLLANRATDFEAALGNLARSWAQDYVGGILLVTDGRQTVGPDPAPVIRSLRARGATVSGVLVGDPGAPQDAVVADVSGSSEVFVGETIPLTVRYRITGGGDLDWNLIVSKEGKEVDRRLVRGTGQWQYETFTFSATNAGTHLFQTRLELAQVQGETVFDKFSGKVNLEKWDNVNGNRVADFVDKPAAKAPPSSTTALERLEYANRGQQYTARIRGFLVPPQSGSFRFWIASDDGSEVWLSASDDPKDKAKIAFVSDYVPRGNWEAQPGQKSQPIVLRANQPCYFEVLHKQGGGEDYLSVGWQLPDGTIERPIPGSRLAAYDPQTVTRIAERRKQSTATKTNQWREASLANNSAEFSVAVNQDPIRVLLVDSTPRWESRYLAAMFERDRRVDLTRRYHSIILDNRALSLLPKTQEEWDSYDMVCLGDLDANELPPEQQKWLASFVARRGGFLVCLAGPRGLPRAFALGTLANVLPVRVSLQAAHNPEPVTVALTSEGASHSIMQVLNDPGYNQRLWPLLPPLQWIADFTIAKPGATVLLTAQNPARTPVVAVQRYGAGRVFWMGTEESWRWRDRLGERVHQTLWLQVMRWGLAGRLRGKDPRLQVGLDRYLITSSESAELKARVSLPGNNPVTEPPGVKLERLGERGEVVPDSVKTFAMLPVTEGPGVWQLPLTDLSEGLWRLTVTHPQVDGGGLTEVRELTVRDQNGVEGLDLSADFANLNRLAGAGGGRAVTMDRAEDLAKEMAAGLKPRAREHRQTLRLWSSYISLIIVGGLLCAEWISRKRAGLP